MKKKLGILLTLVLVLVALFAATAQAACSHTSTKTVIRRANCCTAGYRKTVCNSCNATIRTEVLPATGKHADVTAKSYISPTCTKPGQLRLVCQYSGKTIGYSTVSALGHSTKSSVTLKPTCIATGKVRIECTRCSFSTTTSIPKVSSNHAPSTLGSAYMVSAATCTSARRSEEHFGCCGLVEIIYSGQPAAHKYVLSSSIDAKRTTHSEKICKVCGAYEKITTPAAHTSSHRLVASSSTSRKGPTYATTTCEQCAYSRKTYTPYIYTSADSTSYYESIVK